MAQQVGDGPWILSGLAYVYGRTGQKTRARHELDKLQQLNRDRPLDPAPIFLAYIGMGEKEQEQAFAWLERCYSERSNIISMLKVDPAYDPQRSDPRFQDLLRRVRLDQ